MSYIDQTNYVAKIENLLDDDAYKKVKHDPTSKTETRISTALKECVAKVCRQYLRHLALSMETTSWILSPAPKWAERFHSVHNGKGVGWQDCLSGCAVGEDGDNSPSLCLLQEDTHRQAPPPSIRQRSQ